MRVILQRVTSATVRVESDVVGSIGPGVLLLVGIGRRDGENELAWMAKKIASLRVFPGRGSGFDRSLLENEFGVLAVSQFTLYGDCKKGRRPGFDGALVPEKASILMDRFIELLADEGVSQVESGKFGAEMEVELVNDGPVTLILEREPEGETR